MAPIFEVNLTQMRHFFRLWNRERHSEYGVCSSNFSGWWNNFAFFVTLLLTSTHYLDCFLSLVWVVIFVLSSVLEHQRNLVDWIKHIQTFWERFIQMYFWSTVNKHSTHRTVSFLIRKCLCNMWTRSIEMFAISPISWIFICQSVKTALWMFSMFSWVTALFLQPECSSTNGRERHVWIQEPTSSLLKTIVKHLSK